jgi:protein-tyrosine phosphatase
MATEDLQSNYIQNFRRIDEHLYAGAQPVLPFGIEELVTRYEIQTIVDLQGDMVDEERRACILYNVNYISIPLPGFELGDPPADLMGTIRSTIEEPVNQPVYTHCKFGKDRTGAIVGMYRIDHGATLEDALAEAKHYGMSFWQFGYKDAIEDYAKMKGAK